MTRATRGMLAVPFCAALLAVTGCGGSDGGGSTTTSRASFAQAYKVQRTALDAVGTDIAADVAEAPNQSDDALQAQFSALAERADAALAGLGTLEPTDATRDELATLRKAVGDGARELHAIATAAAGGNAAAAAAASRRLGLAGQRISTVSATLSRELGLPVADTAPPTGDGKITVSYEPPANATAKVARRVLQLGGTDGVASGFTKRFVLPTDLRIKVVNGNVGPNYDPSTKTVTLSYGFVDQIAGILQKGVPGISQYEFGRQIASIDGFILVHELGHAFADVFDLPITGREEDAVDGLATVFLVDAVKGGAEYAFNAARFFKLLSDNRGKLDESAFYDEHSLDAQRAYDIVCTIAGSSEASFAEVRKRNILPQRRLERCPSEYQQKTKAWRALLAPHLR